MGLLVKFPFSLSGRKYRFDPACTNAELEHLLVTLDGRGPKEKRQALDLLLKRHDEACIKTKDNMKQYLITEKELKIIDHCDCTRSWPRAGNHEETCQVQICDRIRKRAKVVK